jgi:hypothetical protein
MAYLGNAPARSFISFERQVFTIVNSQTAYTLDHSVNNENDLRLVINNIVQEPGSGKAYTASGTTLTLSAALTNGTDEMYCVFLGRATATNAPGAGSVGTSQLADNAVTSAKITYPLTTFSSTGIDDNATSTAITIDSSENVGIGISNPTYPLQVYKATSGNIVRLGSVRTLDISNSDNGSYVGAIWDRDINSAGGIHTFSIEGNEKIRILPTGGITFNGDTAAANGLDDYEEGTWTPGCSVASSDVGGTYVKVGNIVTAKFKISIGASGTNINVTGFPFTATSDGEQQGLAREVETQGDLYFVRMAASNTNGSLIRYDADTSLSTADSFQGQVTYISA